jgi:hypothetical protein
VHRPSRYQAVTLKLTTVILRRVSTDIASPACVTFYLSASRGASITTPSWGCGPTPTIFNAVKTTTGSAAAGDSSLTNVPGVGSTGASSAPTVTSAEPGSTQPSDSGSGDPLTKPAEIGTIVGSVLAFLTLIAALVFGINQWKKRQRRP